MSQNMASNVLIGFVAGIYMAANIPFGRQYRFQYSVCDLTIFILEDSKMITVRQ